VLRKAAWRRLWTIKEAYEVMTAPEYIEYDTTYAMSDVIQPILSLCPRPPLTFEGDLLMIEDAPTDSEDDSYSDEGEEDESSDDYEQDSSSEDEYGGSISSGFTEEEGDISGEDTYHEIDAEILPGNRMRISPGDYEKMVMGAARAMAAHGCGPDPEYARCRARWALSYMARRGLRDDCLAAAGIALMRICSKMNEAEFRYALDHG